MNRSDLERLRDAREYVKYAIQDAGGLSAKALAQARQPQHAALFDLVVIGETLNNVSAELKTAAPNLPWRAITNVRNIIIHSYWLIDLEIIADVIENDLGPLLAELTNLIGFVERTDK